MSKEKILKLEEETRELKNQLAMKSNKIKELEYALEHQKPKDSPTGGNAQRIIEIFLEQQDTEAFKNTLDDLLSSFMCFDPAADCSKERNEKVYCVNILKHHINQVTIHQQSSEG